MFSFIIGLCRQNNQELFCHIIIACYYANKQLIKKYEKYAFFSLNPGTIFDRAFMSKFSMQINIYIYKYFSYLLMMLPFFLAQIIIIFTLQFLHFLSFLQSMLNNNQCKAKQIKSPGFHAVNSLKKIRSKDFLRIQQPKGSKYDNQSCNKDKAVKLNFKESFELHSKSKQKNLHHKVIHQEYYMQQQHRQKPKKPVPAQIRKSKSNSKGNLGETKQKKYREDKNNYSKDPGQVQKPNRFNLLSSHSLITFDGQLIRIPPKIEHIHEFNQQNLIHNYTSMSGSEYAAFDRQLTNHRRKHKKVKTISKQKNQNTPVKSKLNENRKTNGPRKHHKSQEHINSGLGTVFDYEFHNKKNLIGEQTQVSPLKEAQYERPQKFDFDQIYQLIQQDIAACKQIKINPDFSKPRKESMKFMSEICGQIQLRRETFYLAISIFDRAITKKINSDNFLLLALVSLTLAMKLQQAQLSLQFVYVLGIINSGKQSYLDSVSSHQSSSKGKSKHKRKQSQLKKTRKHKITIKQSKIRKINTSNISKILKKWQCSKISKVQFMQLEEKVTVYLRFRLWRIQAIFWADLLTCLWDQYLITDKKESNNVVSEKISEGHYESSLSISENVYLLFRCSISLVNISYLYQILQMAYMNESVYHYPSIYIVLSAMYLLVRIAKQNQDNHSNQNGYQFYRQSLINSTNILFVDKTGINRIFWKFIGKLKVEMVQIIGCCQYISQFLQPKILKNPLFPQQNQDSVDNALCLHEFNPNLYTNIS